MAKQKLCLGIESTAHTFGVAVVSFQGKVMSNERVLFRTKKGGMIPAQVADHHVQHCKGVVEQALTKARVSMKDILFIAYSYSPGLGHTLRIGAMVARTLAVLHNKPLVGVNHCIAHLEIGRLVSKAKDPVLLYVSGANTQVIGYEGGKYRIFGETLDIGIGNFLDSFARALGLGFPGGPQIEQLALKSKKFLELPYTVKGMDVSFGGLLTNLKHKIKTGHYNKKDLCYSVQEIVFAEVLEVAERAMAHCDKTELVLGGGVACNKRLQHMAQVMCKERNAKMYVPEKQFLLDNAAMIAWTGILIFNKGKTIPVQKASIDPYERTDDVVIRYRTI